jgi:hypothetical protein
MQGHDERGGREGEGHQQSRDIEFTECADEWDQHETDARHGRTRQEGPMGGDRVTRRATSLLRLAKAKRRNPARQIAALGKSATQETRHQRNDARAHDDEGHERQPTHHLGFGNGEHSTTLSCSREATSRLAKNLALEFGERSPPRDGRAPPPGGSTDPEGKQQK